jgi:hypothetical protein
MAEKNTYDAPRKKTLAVLLYISMEAILMAAIGKEYAHHER